MNLKLEELRRRLLEPVGGTPAQTTSVYKRSSAELHVVTQKINEATDVNAIAPATKTNGNFVYQPPVAPKISGEKILAASTTNIREAALHYAENAAIDTSAGEDSMDSNSQYQVAQAVSKVFEQVKVSILGIVENMSYLEHKGERIDVFGQGGGKRTAEQMNVRFLGELPLDPAVRVGGDSGAPVALHGGPFAELGKTLVKRIEEVGQPTGPTVSIRD